MKKLKVPKIIYEQADVSPEEAQNKLDRAFDILFRKVMLYERKSRKKSHQNMAREES